MDIKETELLDNLLKMKEDYLNRATVKQRITFYIGMFLGSVAFMIISCIGWIYDHFIEIAIAFLSIGLIALFIGCENPQSVNKNKEVNMSEIVFYNDYSFVVPVSGAAQDLSLTPAGDYYGISSPIVESPSIVALTKGCSVEQAELVLKSYRYTFLGPIGLRPGVTSIKNGVKLTANRGTSFSNGSIQTIDLPFISNEWESISNSWVLLPTFTPFLTPKVFPGPFRLIVDTRNLESYFYGSSAIMRVELKAECVITP